ncbi:MAG: oligosaccharide flippase family protein [Parvularculaceae bacterium]
MKTPLFRRLVLGSTASAARTIAGVASAILLMPYLIGALGDAWYGAWVFIGAVLSYAVVLDIGVFAAAERYVSAAFAKKDDAAANRVLATCFWFYTLIGAAAGTAIGGLGAAAPAFIDDPELARAARAALFIGAADTALFFVFGAFNGVIVGRYRYDIASLFGLAKIVGRTVAIFFLVRSPPGLVTLAAITFAFNFAERLARAGLAWRLFPQIDLRPQLSSFAEWKALALFGAKSFLIETADKVRLQIDVVVIGVFLGAAAIVRYNIALRIVSYLAQLGMSAIQVTIPLFSAHAARATRRTLRRDFAIASRMAAIFGGLAIGGAMLVGETVIVLWIGEDYASAAIYLYILGPPLALELAQTPAKNLMVAQNRHGAIAALAWGEAVANIALSIALLQTYGPLGVAIGTAIPMAVARGAIQPALVARANDLPFATVFMNSTGAVFATVALQAPVFYLLGRLSTPKERILIELSIAVAAYVALTAVAFFALFTLRERKLLRRSLQR